MPQILEKIVQVRSEEVHIKEVTRTVEKVVIQERIKEVEKIVPYITEKIIEVPTYKEKTVPLEKVITEIREVPVYIEKIVALTNDVPRVYEVERYQEKVIQVPQIVELPSEIPVIVKIPQIIECIVERICEIPILQEQIVEVPTIEEKIVAVERFNTEVKEVPTYRDRVVEKEVYIQKTDIKNHIETQIKTVDRFEEKIVPVYSSVEKIVEVPYVLEKIVEKIVIMPQVVEVLKYVHEIVEEQTLGIAIGVDIREQEAKYKELYAKVRVHFETMLVELRKMKGSQPGLKVQIEIIEAFLIELDKIVQFARIVQIEKERIVEKNVNVPVLVPTKDSVSIRNELSMSLLVEKLVAELKRLKRDNSSLRLGLDEDVQLIFFSEFLEGKSASLGEDMNRQLTSYRESVYNNLLKHGKAWGTDHEAIFNTVLQERFMMANMIQTANLEIERSRSIANERGEAFRKIKAAHDLVKGGYAGLEKDILELTSSMQGESRWSGLVSRISGSFSGFRSALTSELVTGIISEPIMDLGAIHGTDSNFLRLQSAFRALEKENEILRERYIKWQIDQPNIHLIEDKERIINHLRDQVLSLNTSISSLKGKETVSVNVTGGNSQEYELKIRTLNSRIQELESQLRTQKIDLEGQVRSKTSYIAELEERLGKLGQSGVTASQSQGGLTPYGGTETSGADRLSSSVHSSQSGNERSGSRYGTTTTSTYQAGSGTTGG